MKKKYRILDIDLMIKPYKNDIDLRMDRYYDVRNSLAPKGQTLSSFANGYLYYGFHRTEGGWVYREWAPGVSGISLKGEFNGWDASSHRMRSIGGGNWELIVQGEMPHGSKVRLVMNPGGNEFERIPLYCKRLVQDESSKQYDGVIWDPQSVFEWRVKKFTRMEPLYIYECHIGMSGEREGVSSFSDFTSEVLPRVRELGYTAIQIMAVMEHPYYGSFGYQVSNFFAVSSRFGTPEDFKALVDRSHEMGIAVIMDIVHSHVVRNTVEGPAEFDGTCYQFCHDGEKGDHPTWNTRLFNYGKHEVLHFLLSNIKYWLTEYNLDGFRFDGVTSMLYHHHGVGVAFDSYGKYFSMATDVEAVTYLQLAADLFKEIRPRGVLIAEDMSGMPGMCLPVSYGGVGFDYRLNMGLPDHMIKLMKIPDDNWNMGSLWYELTSRRPEEKVIGYAESHDQSLVGDKTLMFWLADQDMYWHMRKGEQNERIGRAVSLHKMLRFITCSAGGDGYLNFMGNEFGHPEWVDFPREGNGWSYKYARRQWHLADDNNLAYGCLLQFDKAMLEFLTKPSILDKKLKLAFLHEDKKIIAFTKGNYVFVFNFHPRDSYLYKTPGARFLAVAFHTLWKRFGGFVDEAKNEGLIRGEGVVADRRSAVVIEIIN